MRSKLPGGGVGACLKQCGKSRRGILKDYPNIGKDIEEQVKERSVGADAWRRTGVLTFGGNKQVT